MGLINGLVIPAPADERIYLRTFFCTYNDDSEQLEIRFDTLRHVIGCRTIEVIPVQDDHLLSDELMQHDFTAFGDEEGRFANPVPVNERATRILGFPYDLVGTIVVVRYTIDGDSSLYDSTLTHLEQQGIT